MTHGRSEQEQDDCSCHDEPTRAVAHCSRCRPTSDSGIEPLYPEPDTFAQFGAYVDWADVPGLVRDGAEVWSAGYGGDTLDDGEYTVITVDDLWAWGPDENGKQADYATLRAWAPFRSSDAETPERAR